MNREDVILKLARNRVLAHQVLFKHRHSDATPEFHEELIQLWHSPYQRALAMAFREGGKSTIAEEAFVIGVDFELFKNAFIIGNTEKRASERLMAIQHELQTNELNSDLFGEFTEHNSKVWNSTEVILKNGVRITAVGRGQSLRGTKYLHYRPDFWFCDDIEEVEKGQMYSDEEAQETVRWFYKVLLPAMDKNSRGRVNATPLSPNALPMVLMRDKDWVSKVYPIEHKDEEGERKATWPARYPLEWIDAKRASFERIGMLHDYMQEYMCQAEDPKAKLFTESMFRVKPMVRTWHPTFGMYDPARTTGKKSATTGWSYWSWIANRLIVWDGGGELWKPDEIVSHMFKMDGELEPVQIGVEEDGLNEFVMQPIRHEQIRRGFIIPIVSVKAPRGKLEFIGALQPFFLAGEIEFAKDCPVLKSQFLSYPNGRIDGPNALAFALRMRPGQVIYDNFSQHNAAEDILPRERVPIFLALNATQTCTTGVLIQAIDGAFHVLGDYVREGDPGAVLADIVAAAQLEIGRTVRCVSPPRHFGTYDTIGMRGAAGKIPVELRAGTAEIDGREEIRQLLTKTIRGVPALRVSHKARWSLNGFSAGYCRAIGKTGQVQDEARLGVYRTLMEGIESFAGLLKVGAVDDQRDLSYSYTSDGRRYVSALPKGDGQWPRATKM